MAVVSQREGRESTQMPAPGGVWEHGFASAPMRRYIAARATNTNLRRCLVEERRDAWSPLSRAAREGTSIHRKEDIFPRWMLAREDFRNMDQLIQERRLDAALASSPYTRRAEEATVLARLIEDSWATARDLGPERVQQLARCVEFREYAAGQYILAEGSASRSFYIIVRGAVDVVRAGETVATLPSGGCFGENAVQNGGVTNASCIARESVWVLTLTKTDYDDILADVLVWERADAIQVLKRAPIFAGWGRTRVSHVARVCRRVRLAPGSVVVAQGDPPSNVYFVSKGIVELTRLVPTTASNRWPTGARSWAEVRRRTVLPVRLGPLERSDCFGEKAVLEDGPSDATATCTTEVVLLSLDKNDFIGLLRASSKLDEIRALVGRWYPSDCDLLLAAGVIR